jgi:hypothetical protein
MDSVGSGPPRSLGWNRGVKWAVVVLLAIWLLYLFVSWLGSGA